MALSLNGKNVLITGGTGGLGLWVVEAFVAAGAQVYVPAKGAIAAGARPIASVDVTNEEAVTKLFASVPPLWASVHVVGGYAMKPLLETTLADAHAQVDLNFGSAFLCTREAARNMLAAEGGRGGRIVNISSHAAETAPSQMAVYAASKAAVIALTRSAAAELRGRNVLVNTVAPTTIDTPANRAAMPKADHAGWAKPADIAQTILWLCSMENALVTGSVVTVGA